ncbi:lipoyl synthase [Paracoccus sp. S4493]|uniref:hypothetical protein n=1 Tax=Paracoccus sp. S4493 TaxID=579490 RepID=UPI0005F9FA5F|nr:hypothetical protein [Paracoccus sp. S4493]KJZ32983.1 lipoyl synthase [Paracoccus sp. S4493]TYP60449.1 hypothetical protein A9A71_12150 [Stutzerimonas stutzeri]
MNMIWLLRAAKWARNPPSAKMVKLVIAVIAIGLALLALEKLGWWPGWATQDQRPHRLPR